jgi:transcriptional regulator with XRE-family HTH domain
MTDIKYKVGQQIREARKAKGLTQKELGALMGLSESVVNKYEAGKQNLSLETVQKVALALGMDLSVMIK